MSRSCRLTCWQMTAGLSRTEHPASRAAGRWEGLGGRWQPRIFDPWLPEAPHPHTHTHARHICPNLRRALLHRLKLGLFLEKGSVTGTWDPGNHPLKAGQQQTSVQVRGRVLMPRKGLLCSPGGGETPRPGLGGAVVCVRMPLYPSQLQGALIWPPALLWRGP